jgi:hypothetical protein
VTACISGVAYILVSYTIRFVLYAVVYTAVWVFIVGMFLNDRSEGLLKRDSRWPTTEESDDTNYQTLLPERVNQ